MRELLLKTEFPLVVEDFVSFVSVDNTKQDFSFSLSWFQMHLFPFKIFLHGLDFVLALVFSTIKVILFQLILVFLFLF